MDQFFWSARIVKNSPISTGINILVIRNSCIYGGPLNGISHVGCIDFKVV